MTYKISKSNKVLKGTVYLTASKSESNRVLLIQALSQQRFRTYNLADSMDTEILAEILKIESSGEHSKALKKLNSEVNYYTGPGGTTIRFLTAFFATREGTRILTGSDRMNQRPIRTLVDALNSLGAKITYLGKEGCPPIKIEGKKIKGGDIEIGANISSQFISALLLIAPTLENGLNIHLNSQVVSSSYILMTLKILEHFGIKYKWVANVISVAHQEYQGWDYHVESDWSAASYWYEMVALAQEADIKIMGLKKKSIQGDSVIAGLFQFFGVNTEFIEDGIKLTKTKYIPESLSFDFSEYPDIFQTASVVAAVKNIPVQFNGLHTLRNKESDRIHAIITELKKIGVHAVETGETNVQINGIKSAGKKEERLEFKTYNDHRMAMAFAPLSLIFSEVNIEDPIVVKKSYPDFWNDIKSLGFEIKEC